VDAKADARLRFFAARKLCAGQLDAASIDKLLAAEGKLVPMLAIESLTSPESVAAHVGQFTRLPGYMFLHSFWSGPVRDAMARGGSKAVRALVEHVEKTPADALLGLDVLYDTPGPDSAAALTAIMTDAARPMELRLRAAYLLGWRKDATEAEKDAALGFLMPMLDDPKTRLSAAGILQPRYFWGHGLWSNDPRVLEAAKTAAEKEKTAAAPDQAFLAVLEKIIQRRE